MIGTSPVKGAYWVLEEAKEIIINGQVRPLTRKEKKAITDKAYRERNKEKLQEKHRAYYQLNKEKKKAYQKAYYKENKFR